MNVKYCLESFIELSVKVILWIVFQWFDNTDPFIRFIAPEEVWLYKYPLTPSYVPSVMLWFITFGVPLLCFLAFYFLNKRNMGEVTILISALSLALLLNGCFTSIIKVMVGRPRPDFVNRCFPDGIGTDFTKCTGQSRDINDGRKSFPSGHASFSFTSMIFTSLVISNKLQVWKTIHFRGLKLFLCICPILIAISIAISRTCDYHHHYGDVIAGGLLGTLIAYVSYHLYIPSESVEDPHFKKESSGNIEVQTSLLSL